MLLDNVATHVCADGDGGVFHTPKKKTSNANHSSQTDNGLENIVGHMTRQIQRVHCNKHCECPSKQTMKNIPTSAPPPPKNAAWV